MTREEYKAAVMDMAYLAACAVNGDIPVASRISKIDLPLLYWTADRHLLTGITAIALESAGVHDKEFTQAKGKAIRKVATFDMERTAVLEALEKAGIWYMPLKGSVLKDLYPMIGMRQMADNDILYDASRTADVRIIMEELGFVTDKCFGRGVHDHYIKPPVCSFEMHRMLFGVSHDNDLQEYYQNVKEHLLQDEGRQYGYHFSSEDFYIYMIAHEYKHYSSGGTGIRSLLDTYVYLNRKGEALDWPYVTCELKKLGIAGFEAQNRSLALHLFGGETLTGADGKMLDYMCFSGTYGKVSNRVKNRIAKYGDGPFGKLRYVLSRIFLPMKVVRDYFPLFGKYPILLPFLPIYRLFRGLTSGRGRMRVELKELAEYKSSRK